MARISQTLAQGRALLFQFFGASRPHLRCERLPVGPLVRGLQPQKLADRHLVWLIQINTGRINLAALPSVARGFALSGRKERSQLRRGVIKLPNLGVRANDRKISMRRAVIALHNCAESIGWNAASDARAKHGIHRSSRRIARSLSARVVVGRLRCRSHRRRELIGGIVAHRLQEALTLADRLASRMGEELRDRGTNGPKRVRWVLRDVWLPADCAQRGLPSPRKQFRQRRHQTRSLAGLAPDSISSTVMFSAPRIAGVFFSGCGVIVR